MKVKYFIILLLGFLSFLAIPKVSAQEVKNFKPVIVRVFHSPRCGACLKAIHNVIPAIAKKYSDKALWQFFDITDAENYKCFLHLKRTPENKISTPTILVGQKMLVGLAQISDLLDSTIDSELKNSSPDLDLNKCAVDLVENFKKFGALAVISAGLVDGVNPCAFTVVIFFVSFLAFMGYKKRETAWIGIAYILAVFLTYLGLGFGLFKALYHFKFFYLISKVVYVAIGSFCLFLGSMAIRDYIVYKRTGKTDDMSLQLPAYIKTKIHNIMSSFYRKEKDAHNKTLPALVGSALVVGFLVSLLEAVCTGQLYLPTIVFVLKEGTLRGRALFYLIIYNLMFILPLIGVLVLALTGVSSQQFESYTRKNLGIVKLVMAAVFLALGVVLLISL